MQGFFKGIVEVANAPDIKREPVVALEFAGQTALDEA